MPYSEPEVKNEQKYQHYLCSKSKTLYRTGSGSNWSFYNFMGLVSLKPEFREGHDRACNSAVKSGVLVSVSGNDIGCYLRLTGLTT